MSQSESTNTPGEKSGKELIFVVDDEPLLVEMAQTLLDAEGYQTKAFCEPENVLQALEEADHKPDLLITDCLMGSMDGLELIDRCRKVQPGLKTLLLSGTVDENFLQQQPVKPDKFLSKPYRVRKFLKVVKDILQGRQSA